MKRHSLALRLVFVLIMLLLSSARGKAQTATVGGMIVDASGAVVSGASITTQNAETGVSRDAASNDAGLFRFSNLPPGPYTITIEKQGFRTIHIPDLVLTVNQAFTFEATLQVATVATTTEVKASELPLIDLESAQISNLVDSKRITDLPLLTRDPYSLILLSPGVVQSNSYNGGFSVNGTSERNNNFVLDGADNNDTEVPGIPGGINSLNPDSTQEFRVITNSFAPEYGRNDGALVEVITRGGSNELHGSAYWFGRYNALGARDYFNSAAATGPQNPYVRNDFGGSAGGRIIKDRTFWFANYEGQRFVTTLTTSSTVPTSDFVSGNFNVLGQQIDLQTPNSLQNATPYSLDPTIQGILALYTKYTPNGPAVIPGLSATLFYPSTSRLTADDFTVKIDHNLSKKHVLMGRYAFNRSGDPNTAPHTDFLPGGLGATSFYQRAQNGVIGLTSTLSDRLVNEFRFAANRNHLDFNCTGVSTFNGFGHVDTFGRGADYGMPFSSSGFGCQALFDSDGQARNTGTYQTIDNLSYVTGHHLFKWGAEFRAVYSNSYDNFSTRALFDFSAYSNTGAEFLQNLPPDSPLLDPANSDALAAVENGASLLFGYADNQFQTQYFDHAGNRTPGDARKLRQREWGAYAQDTWKLSPHLSVTYGLRWEYFGVPFEADNNLSTLNADPSGPAPFTFSIVGPGTGNSLYKNQFTNFEPRIGLAWDPFKKGQTSVRAAYGIYHDRIFGNLVGNIRGNPPFAQSSIFPSPDILPNISTPATVSTSPTLDNGAGFAATLIDPNFKTPYSQNWNFGIQHAITPTVTIEVNYVGVKGDRLYRVVDGNPPQPGLLNQLLQICTPTNPANTLGCSSGTLQFYNLWTGADGSNPVLPFDAVNNNALVYFGYPGAVLIKSIGSSIYHGMQVNLQKHFSSGFQIQGAYTFSHAIDNVNDPISPAKGNGSFPFNSLNLQAERGNSDFDIRHRGVVNFIYEPNIGRGRGHLSSGFLGRVLEGWSLTGIVQAQTGHPYDIYDSSQDSNHTGLPARGTIVGSAAQPPGTDKTYTGPAGIATTPFDTQPNIGKNQFYGPNYVNVDTAVLKTTSLTEKLKLQFRLEAFNLFNHTQFNQPDNNIADGSTFGESLSTLTRPDGTTSARQLQVALKLMF